MSDPSTASELAPFFQLVREIERTTLYRSADSGKPVSALGDDGIPANESLRFKGNNSLAFPGSAVENLKTRLHNESTGEVENRDVVVNFMGLTGPTGVLPQHYSRLVMERIKQRDVGLADFLDLFNHRLVSLFYRSWTKYRFAVQYERYSHLNKRDPFTRVIQSLSGQHEMQSYETQLYYAGHFSRNNRSAANLGHMLEDFLSLPVKIHSFIGQWLNIVERDRAVLGRINAIKENRLGRGILPGRRCWDRQSKINIEIGPIDHQTYQALLPGGDGFAEFKVLINRYVPVHLVIDLIFNIKDKKENAKRLGGGLQLAKNTWLQSLNKSELSAKVRLDRNNCT